MHLIWLFLCRRQMTNRLTDNSVAMSRVVMVSLMERVLIRCVTSPTPPVCARQNTNTSQCFQPKSSHIVIHCLMNSPDPLSVTTRRRGESWRGKKVQKKSRACSNISRQTSLPSSTLYLTTYKSEIDLLFFLSFLFFQNNKGVSRLFNGQWSEIV